MKVGLIRDKKSVVLKAKIDRRPAESKVAKVEIEKEEEKDDFTKEAWRGIKVGAITQERAEQFGIENKKGVIIEGLQAGSPAHNAGLRGGDVIREIDRTPITGLKAFNKVARNLKGNILVRTDRGYVVIKEEFEDR